MAWTRRKKQVIAENEIQTVHINTLMGRRRARRLVRLLWTINHASFPVILAMAVLLSVAVALLDMVFGFAHGLNILYVIPVVLASWRGRFVFGQVTAFLVAGGMTFTRMVAGVVHQDPGDTAAYFIPIAAYLCLVSYLVVVICRILFYEQRSSHTDPLTGLANWRLLIEEYRAEVARSRRYQRPLSVVYLDVDDFKAVNDLHGHSAGDEVLKSLAELLVSNTRTIDTVARVGGDEFALMLPETGEAGVRAMLERMHKRIGDSLVCAGKPVGISMGAAVFMDPPDNIEILLKAADRQLSLVKEAGKNAVKVAVVS